MNEFSFTKESRLTREADFERVYAKGKRLRGDTLMLVCLANARGCSRLGVSVGKKFGDAVARNRIKRVFREVFRIHRAELAKQYDIIMIPRNGEAAADFGKVEAEFLKLVSEL